MEVSREDVLSTVISALQEAQEDILEDAIVIGENTRPIGDLNAFDSLTSVMVTVHCLDSLGYTDPLNFPTLFIDKSGNALTVGQVVDRILELLKK